MLRRLPLKHVLELEEATRGFEKKISLLKDWGSG